jgi:formylglycine-generating enzyme required for sulfatase activity
MISKGDLSGKITFDVSSSAGTSLTVMLQAGCPVDLVWCPPGMACIGSPPSAGDFLEQPRQPVRFTRGFWIGRTPVTWRLWDVVMGSTSTPHRHPSETGDGPAHTIEWGQACEFCTSLTARLRQQSTLSEGAAGLPLEAEWEYACRAGTDTVWFFGDDLGLLGDYAWYEANSGNRPHPVAGRKPNPWGLYDVYGNVAEWCLDFPELYSGIEITDPVRPGRDEILKAVRGGEYSSPAYECRSAYRSSCSSGNDYNEPTGIRLVVRGRG